MSATQSLAPPPNSTTNNSPLPDHQPTLGFPHISYSPSHFLKTPRSCSSDTDHLPFSFFLKHNSPLHSQQLHHQRLPITAPSLNYISTASSNSSPHQLLTSQQPIPSPPTTTHTAPTRLLSSPTQHPSPTVPQAPPRHILLPATPTTAPSDSTLFSTTTTPPSVTPPQQPIPLFFFSLFHAASPSPSQHLLPQVSSAPSQHPLPRASPSPSQHPLTAASPSLSRTTHTRTSSLPLLHLPLPSTSTALTISPPP